MKKIKPKLAISWNDLRLEAGQIALVQAGILPIKQIAMIFFDKKKQITTVDSLTEDRWTKNNTSNNLSNNLWLTNVSK